MRTLLTALFLSAALAGCADDSGPAPLFTASVRVGFPTGGLPDTIDIRTVDRLALRAAELVAPDGAIAPSAPIDVDRRPNFSTGQFAAENAFKSGVAGGPGTAVLTPRDAQSAATLRSETQILTTVSHASILLPDPSEYRRDWRNYRIRLVFGTGAGDAETRELAAPEPPPSAR